MDALPPELWIDIFSRVPLLSRLLARGVCRAWRTFLTGHPHLWRMLELACATSDLSKCVAEPKQQHEARQKEVLSAVCAAAQGQVESLDLATLPVRDFLELARGDEAVCAVCVRLRTLVAPQLHVRCRSSLSPLDTVNDVLALTPQLLELRCDIECTVAWLLARHFDPCVLMPVKLTVYLTGTSAQELDAEVHELATALAGARGAGLWELTLSMFDVDADFCIVCSRAECACWHGHRAAAARTLSPLPHVACGCVCAHLSA